MNAISIEVSVSAIAAFSGDGRVFRAFGHLVAARHGDLLVVPLGRTTGDLRAVIDGCPVPWVEIAAVIDAAPSRARQVPPETMCGEHPRLAAFTPYGWEADVMALAGSKTNVERLVHVSGIRYAKVS